MRKIKLRVIATMLSALIAISSLSIASVSAAETTSSSISASSNASEYVFTDADLDEFRVKLKAYLDLNKPLKELPNNPEVRELALGEYVIRKDNQKDLTDTELQHLARNLDFYFVAKEFLKGGFGKWEEPGFFYDPPIEHTTFPPEVINSVVKFPKDVAIYKLPDDKHPKGLVIFRDCIPSIADKTLCQKAYDAAYKCFIHVPNANNIGYIEDAHYYWLCNWDICDKTVAEYKKEYGDYGWYSELSADFNAVLCNVE